MENDFNTSEWKMIIILVNTEKINVREERTEQIPMTEITEMVPRKKDSKDRIRYR